MTLAKPPFPTDAERKGSVVVPAGAYAWLKGRLGVGAISPVAPDTGALGLQAFVLVKDPDDVLLDWGVTVADPDDPGDTYTSANAQYAGLAARRTLADGDTASGLPTVASATGAFTTLDIGKLVVGAGIPVGATIIGVPDSTHITLSANATATASSVSLTVGEEIVGLYAEGYPGLLTGRFALKILVPADAEQTWLSTTRQYTVSWRIVKNGQAVDGFEEFNVGPVGIVVFGQSFVTNDEVTQGIVTELSPEAVTDLIVEASEIVGADLLDECGYDITTAAELDPSLRIAVIQRARSLIIGRDASLSGGMISRISEGSESISYSASLLMKPDSLNDDALRRVVRFCKRTSSRYLPTFSVANRPVPRLDDTAAPYIVGPWVL